MNIDPSDGGPGLTHVFHVADLHVSTDGSRLDEYARVFDEFVREAGAHPATAAGTAAMVVAGDVLHNKCRASTDGALMLFEFLNRCLELFPVLLICGNHDFRQDEPDCADAAEMLAAPYQGRAGHGVHYLRETGVYLFGGVCFGVVSVRDTLRARNTCGRVDVLPPYPVPPPLGGGVTARVALFHGTMAECEGAPMPGAYPLSWVSGAGYDIGMFGDNHVQQVRRAPGGMAWGYPGSTVQQTFGEPLSGHGYLVWDLAARRAEARSLRNEYGRVTVGPRGGGGWAVWSAGGEPEPLDDAARAGRLPCRAAVRLAGGDPREALAALARAGAYGATVRQVARADHAGRALAPAETWREAELATSGSVFAFLRAEGGAGGLDVSDPDTAGFVSGAGACLPAGAASEVGFDARGWNAEIARLEEAAAAAAAGGAPRASARLTGVSWGWLFCYGGANSVDLRGLEGRVALLSGANASGKSSFMDVLCFAMHGVTSSGRAGAEDVACRCRPPGEEAWVSLWFESGGETREVRRWLPWRAGGRRGAGASWQCRVAGASGATVAEGRIKVREYTESVFGAPGCLLRGGMVAHGAAASFLGMRPAEQRAHLEAALGLASDSPLERLLRRSLAGHEAAAAALRAALAHAGNSDADAAPVEGGRERLCEKRSMLEATARRMDALSAERAEAASAGLPAGALETMGPGDRAAVDIAVAWGGGARGRMPSAAADAARLPELRAELLALVSESEALRRSGGGGEPEGCPGAAAPRDLAALAVAEREIADRRAALMQMSFLSTHAGGAGAPPSPEPLPPAPDVGRAIALVGDLRVAEDRARAARRRAEEARRVLEEAGPSPVRPAPGGIDALRERLDRARRAEGRLAEARASLESLRSDADADIDANPDCDSCRRRASYRRREAARAGLAAASDEAEGAARAAALDAPSAEIAGMIAFEETAERVRAAERDARDASELLGRAEAAVAGAARAWAHAVERADAAAGDVAAMIRSARLSERAGLLDAIATLERRVSSALAFRRAAGMDAREALAICSSRSRLAAAASEWGRLDAERAALMDECQRAAAEVAVAERAAGRIERERRMALAADGLEGRARKLSAVLAMLSGKSGAPSYREWLYSRHVAPYLEAAMDDIAGDVAGFSVRVDVVGGDELRFRIVDRGATTCIERASGYQTFVAGLAVRAAICGAGGGGGGVLFIDEGFACCDSDNMLRAREVVDAVRRKGGFTSAVIASHLDGIKDIADVSIPIVRAPGGVSSVEFPAPSCAT